MAGVEDIGLATWFIVMMIRVLFELRDLIGMWLHGYADRVDIVYQRQNT